MKLLSLVIGSLLVSCGGGSSTSPTISLTTPGAGASVSFDADNPDVDVAFAVTGFTLKDPGMCGTTASCGHVELFIDGTTCDDQSDPSDKKPYNEAASASPTTAGLDYCPTFPSVAGTHTLKAELHKDDLSPVLGSDGKAIATQVTFNAVLSADGGSGDMTTGPCGTVANPIQVGPGHSFTPPNCVIAAGSTVNWVWENQEHTVTNDPSSAATTFDSGAQSSGTFTFTVPANAASGTVINYHCSIHATVTASACSGMCATLTVQ